MFALLAGIGHGYSTTRATPPFKPAVVRELSHRSKASSSSSSSSSSSIASHDALPPFDRATFLSRTSSSSRRRVLAISLLLPLVSSIVDVPSAHAAKDVDPALKGTKSDPAFQGCLSECVYECTKPKGTEQKSRAECIPECKAKCATSKAQLMLGTAK